MLARNAILHLPALTFYYFLDVITSPLTTAPTRRMHVPRCFNNSIKKLGFSDALDFKYAMYLVSKSHTINSIN